MVSASRVEAPKISREQATDGEGLDEMDCSEGCPRAATAFSVPGVRVLKVDRDDRGLVLTVDTAQRVEGCRTWGVLAVLHDRRWGGPPTPSTTATPRSRRSPVSDCECLAPTSNGAERAQRCRRTIRSGGTLARCRQDAVGRVKTWVGTLLLQ